MCIPIDSKHQPRYKWDFNLHKKITMQNYIEEWNWPSMFLGPPPTKHCLRLASNLHLDWLTYLPFLNNHNVLIEQVDPIFSGMGHGKWLQKCCHQELDILEILELRLNFSSWWKVFWTPLKSKTFWTLITHGMISRTSYTNFL
jgi:hypothetical protein